VLVDLVVHNFAIIRHLEISFQTGLNIITGETGAGKSILVGAVNLLLGSRASQEMIRTGTDEATVEAIFHLPNSAPVGEPLEKWGLQSGNEVLIRRSINRTGRNRVFVGDQLVTLQQLQQLATGMVSVSGQHEHQLLLDAELHLGLLDNFGKLEEPCREVKDLYAEWSKTRETLHNLERLKHEKAAQLDYLRYQLQELESAKLIPGEEKELEQERNILKHAATLMQSGEGAHQILYSGRGAIIEQLSGVGKHLETLKQIDPSQQYLIEHLEQARIHLEELAHSLHQFVQHVSADPHRLSAVEERLAQLQRLAKKYGGSVDAMLQRLQDLRGALAEEEDSDVREDELAGHLRRLRESYLEKAKGLSARRQAAAEQLGREVENILVALDMPRVRFAVSFDHGEKNSDETTFTPMGIDRVEFLLSANPGEDVKPLARIASGGELSRVLLALKSLLSHRGEAETLIFDEVDAGIGGRTAELVGVQLAKLSQKHQVICITHLPQIACYGQSHYRVAKEITGEETATRIQRLSAEERMEELARMLGGISISEKTRAHARELLLQAQKRS
jgi:DNA repair protein RecN (Recombination protein N)